MKTMLLMNLALSAGWAGDRCLDLSEWCMRRARGDRMSPLANMVASMIIAAFGALLAVVVVGAML